MLDYHKLLDFMNDYISHYRELLNFENSKLRLIFTDDVEGLNKSLSGEQALIMKTNSLEAKRFDIMRGEEKSTFKQLIQKAPEDCRSQLNDQYKELSELIFQIKKINDSAHDIVSKRLSAMEDAKNPPAGDTYGRTGAKRHSSDEGTALDKGI